MVDVEDAVEMVYLVLQYLREQIFGAQSYELGGVVLGPELDPDRSHDMCLVPGDA